MRSIDNSKTKSRQRAGIEYVLLANRFEWLAKGWFNPVTLNLESGQAIELLYFRSSDANLTLRPVFSRMEKCFGLGLSSRTSMAP